MSSPRRKSARRWPPTSRSRWPRSGCRTPRCTCAWPTVPTRRPNGRPAWTPPPTAGRAGGSTWTSPTSTSGPRTSGARRSTSGSGSVSGACGRRSPVECSPSSSRCTRAASGGWGSKTRRSAAAEIAKWTDQSERIGRALSASALAARHATSDELAWLLRHAMMGSLGEPPASASNPADRGVRARSRACSRARCTTVARCSSSSTPPGDSYAAFLSFSRFPDVMSFPDGEPWLHYADSLPFPVEVSSRMRLIPPAEGQQGRQPPPGPRPGHGRAHPRGRGGGADRAGRADRRGPDARARHHQGTAAVRVRLAPADRERARPRTCASGGSRRSSSTTGTSASTSSTRPATSSRCCASRCPATACGSTPTCSASRCTRSRAACRPPPWTWGTGSPRVWAGSARISARRWAGPAPSCTSTRCWPRRATGRPRSRSPVSRAAARPRWRC